MTILRSKSLVLLATLGTGACYIGSASDGLGRDEAGDGGDGDSDDDDDTPVASEDVGRVALHRLTRTEYESTLTDLFGRSFPAADFIRGGTGVGFANQADLLRDISEDLARGYIEHASDVAAKVVTDPAARARVTTCPANEVNDACVRETVESFGLRAWRRPLDPEESQRLEGRVHDAIAAGATPDEALELLVRMLIGSPHFVFHVEIDAEPEDPRPHRLSGFELASRLSYMLWSSLPDDALFEHAANGTLDDDAVLVAEVDRMLEDERAVRFRSAFLERWLNVPLLDAQVQLLDTDVYPSFTPALGQDMRAELEAFLTEFIADDPPWPAFVTADVHYVTPLLAEHYGIPLPETPMPAGGWTPVRVEDHADARAGFLGLAGFLTYTSRADRTAPTLRGKIVLESLQCITLVIPPNVPELEPEGEGTTEFPSIRERLEAHRASPDCAACHNLLDPIGLALENFDAIGSWRDAYEDGYTIDASAEFYGEPIDGLLDLAHGLAEQPSFLRCPSQKLFTYALRRTPAGDDTKWIARLSTEWSAGTLRDLVKRMVTSEAFRFRRGVSDEGGD